MYLSAVTHHQTAHLGGAIKTSDGKTHAFTCVTCGKRVEFESAGRLVTYLLGGVLGPLLFIYGLNHEHRLIPKVLAMIIGVVATTLPFVFLLEIINRLRHPMK